MDVPFNLKIHLLSLFLRDGVNKLYVFFISLLLAARSSPYWPPNLTADAACPRFDFVQPFLIFYAVLVMLDGRVIDTKRFGAIRIVRQRVEIQGGIPTRRLFFDLLALSSCPVVLPCLRFRADPPRIMAGPFRLKMFRCHGV